MEKTIRDRVIEIFVEALGSPYSMHVDTGDVHRWTLQRPYDVNMYITIDTPEREDFAHIMVSDDESRQEKPVVNYIVYSVEEAKTLLQRLLQQWKLQKP